jgi:membrane protease YdiL (CAAX protease family)
MKCNIQVIMKKINFPILILISYLIIRIPVGSWLVLIIGPLPEWLGFFIELFSYICCGFLIIIYQHSLTDYHIDPLALVIYFLWGTIFRQSTSPGLHDALFWIVALFVLFRTWRLLKAIRITGRLAAWTGFGLFSITLIAFPAQMVNYYDSYKQMMVGYDYSSIIIPSMISSFTYFLGHGALFEELMFRGFLWGFLRNRGMSDKRIFVLQLILTWLAHINQIDYPLAVLVITPLLGAFFGALVWRSRLISVNILSHAMYNSIIRNSFMIYITLGF